MRSFEERKAEVLRRSENRIRERRRNCTRILALGVSLCVILIICSIVIRPDIRDNNETVSEDNQVIASDSETDCSSKVHNFVSVSVFGEGNCQYTKDYADVTKVFNQIYDIFEANGGYKDMIVESENPTLEDYGVPETGVNFGGATDMEDDYIITMESEGGAVREYTLNENVLFDKAFDREIILTEKQLSELKAVLGLTN